MEALAVIANIFLALIFSPILILHSLAQPEEIQARQPKCLEYEPYIKEISTHEPVFLFEENGTSTYYMGNATSSWRCVRYEEIINNEK